MKIRWLGPSVEGAFHNNLQGVKRGQVIDTNGPDYLITETSLHDYFANHLAEPFHEAPKAAPPVERAVAPPHETAKLEVPPEPPKLEAVPEPLDEPDEPEPEHKTRPPVRRPRR